MTEKTFKFQQGRMLHDAIMGAFRARGMQLEIWCAENSISPSSVRSATYGQAGGRKGHELLNRVIDAAGRSYVEQAYFERVQFHLKELKKGAA